MAAAGGPVLVTPELFQRRRLIAEERRRGQRPMCEPLCTPTQMEEDERVLASLGSPRQCGAALRTLLSRLPQSGGRLQFSQRAALLTALPRVLQDSGRELRPLCLQLLAELCSGEESDLEPLRLAVLPQLLPGEEASLGRAGLGAPSSTQDTRPPQEQSSKLGMDQEKHQKTNSQGRPGALPSSQTGDKSSLREVDPEQTSRALALGRLGALTSSQARDTLLVTDPEQTSRAPARGRQGALTSSQDRDSVLETDPEQTSRAPARGRLQALTNSQARDPLLESDPKKTSRALTSSQARDTLPPRDKSSMLGIVPVQNCRVPAQGRSGALTSSQALDSLLSRDHNLLLGMDQEKSKRAPVQRRPGDLTSSWAKDPLPPQDLSTLKFGLIPTDLYCTLLDQEDYRGRTHAMEELKDLVQDFSPAPTRSSSVLDLISFLCNLLDDSNFKVQHGALEVLNLLVGNLGQSLEQYLQPLISATVKVLGDSKPVLRQEYMKMYMRLMKVVGPQKVLRILLEHAKHKLSRVREEVVNIAIAALLTYPSEDFNLPQLSCNIAPSLVDSKRKVRHAALEAFAVLAFSMGPGKSSLLKAVDDVELQEEGDGVMNAVQARLARKTLPKLDAQGLVDYAIPLPSSAHGRGAHLLPGADTDWLLSGYRTQSAHLPSGDHIPRRYGSYNDLLDDPIFSARRVRSAGKGKNKLPWDKEPNSAVGLQANNAPCAKELQQFPVLSDLQSPTLKSTQGVQRSDDAGGIHKRASRISHTFQNSWDFSMDSLNAGTGLMDHQPFISGKREHHGFSHTRGKSGSVDSELQFLGTNNHRQEKASVFGSLNPSKRAHQPFSTAAEQTLSFPGSSTSQGSFILPSYPLSSPRASPKQTTSSSSGSPKKSQDAVVAFSNSWPLKSFDGRPKPTKLSNQKLGETAGEHSQETHSPLPLKPALVRTPSSRVSLNGHKPFPPITRGASSLPDKCEINPTRLEKEADIWESEKDKKLTIDLSELNVKDEIDHEEMVSSLRSLHNSAAKKRAKLSGSTSDLDSPESVKLDLTLDSASHASSPTLSPYSESGIYSLESLTSPLSPTGHGKRISDVFPPNGSKTHPARVPSAHRKGNHVREHSPSQVITTNEISSLDVSVIGQRMNYGSGAADFEAVIQKEVSASPFRGHTKEQQRYPKHTKGFTGSTGSLPQINSLDSIATRTFPEESVVIVGKGVFGSPPSPSLPYNQSISNLENRDLCSVKQSVEPLSGVYGRAVQQNSPANYDGLENDKDVEVTISKSAWDKMRRKKELGHREHPEARDHEKAKDNDKKQQLKHVELDLATESGLSPGIRLRYKDRTPSSTFIPEIMDPAEFQPFLKPELALSEALRFLADDDWEKKIEGLNYIRCLSAFHCDVLTAKLHDTSLAVVQEVKNLRSGVSRAAVVCLGDLFTHLKKNMDQELDCAVKCLLHKASESNTFIREDVDKALNAMALNITPARALGSLLNGGLSHLHSAVRKCTAQHLSDVVDRMGPGRILSGIKDVTDRILPAVAKFAQDTSPETRFYGRKMIFLLMSHPDFDRIIEKYVQPKDLPYIKESVNNLRQKGLGEMPLDTPSAKGRRSHRGSFRNMRSSSTSRDALNVTERETGETARKLVPRNPLESAEYVKSLTASLNAKDFRDRIEGIKNLLADCETNQDLVVTNIVKIFDAFKSRLHDSNSKVNLMALETMQKIIPLLKDSLSAVVNMLIPAIVDNNLNSKNPGIYSAATNVVQALIKHLDSYLLLPIFCSKAQHLNGKAKQDITETLADIVMDLYPQKPHAVEQKVVVVLWHLLRNLTNSGSLPGAGGNMRTATAKLSKALFAQMGENLLNQAASQPPHIKNILEEFLERST